MKLLRTNMILAWFQQRKPGNPFCVYGLEDLILFTCANYPSQSVQSLSHFQLWLHGLQHARLLFPSPTPGVYSNSCPSTWWGHPTILSSVVPFSCLQSFPASGSFPVNWLFVSGGQSIGVSASESVLPMNTQDWFSLGSACWISLQSKGLRYAIIKIRAYYHSRNLVPRMI